MERTEANGRALGALIAANGEAGGGESLRATLPLAGRTVVDHQARAAAATGASPVVVLAARVTDAMEATLDELARDGVPVLLARDADEAADALGGGPVLLIGDGVVASPASLRRVAAGGHAAVLTVHDGPGADRWERIDAGTRWAGVALAPGEMLADTAEGLGDWDLHSTLLRRLVQDGARRMPTSEQGGADAGAPVLADTASEAQAIAGRLLADAQSARNDWVRARLLPVIEAPLVERLAGTRATSRVLAGAALGSMLLGAVFLARGWFGAGLVALLLATPLEGAAERLAALRLQRDGGWARLPIAFPLAASAALLTLAGRLWADGEGWGCGLAAVATLAACAAAREEGRGTPSPAASWRLTHANAIWAAVPFAVFGWWRAGLLGLCVWSFVSFWHAQRRAHRPTAANTTV